MIKQGDVIKIKYIDRFILEYNSLFFEMQRQHVLTMCIEINSKKKEQYAI